MPIANPNPRYSQLRAPFQAWSGTLSARRVPRLALSALYADWCAQTSPCSTKASSRTLVGSKSPTEDINGKSVPVDDKGLPALPKGAPVLRQEEKEVFFILAGTLVSTTNPKQKAEIRDFVFSDVNPTKVGDDSDRLKLQVVSPEPATFTLIGLGTLGLLGYSWRRRKRVAT
jgi:hypothetical protein